MLDDIKITYKQLILLIVINRIILGITYFPPLIIPSLNQDIALAAILSIPLTLLASVPIYLLSKRFSNESIIKYSVTIAGKTVGKVIGFLYVWLFLNQAAMSIMQFTHFLTTAIMPETPRLFFVISLVVACAYAVKNGLEVICRFCELIVPIVMVAIISIFLLLVKDINLKVFLPVMEEGLFPVLHGMLFMIALTTEIIGFAMLLPYLNEKQKTKKILILSFLSINAFFVLTDIAVLGVLGVQLSKTQEFVFYGVIRLINVGDFIERIEAIHIAIWTLGMFIRVSFYYYLAVLGIGQIFGFGSDKHLVVPLGSLLIPLSILIAPDIVELKEFTSYKTFTWYTLFFIVVIPSLLLLTAIIKEKLKDINQTRV